MEFINWVKWKAKHVWSARPGGDFCDGLLAVVMGV